MAEEYAMSEEIIPRTASSSLKKISKKGAEDKEPAMKKHKFLQSCISQQSSKTPVVTNRVFDLTTKEAKQAILPMQFHVENVGSGFKADNSLTHQNLSEFNFLDVEMEIHNDYSEIIDLVDQLLVFIFTRLNEKCAKQLEAIKEQYPFEPLKILSKTLRLTFEEGVQMLDEAGVEVDPIRSLTTESKRKLGQLVLEKFNTELFILHLCSLVGRPFYTMPCGDDSRYCNSFDVFIRGEEIISGAQHIHDPKVLENRSLECGITVETITSYTDSLRYGTPLHGGFRMILERVAMLYCALS